MTGEPVEGGDRESVRVLSPVERLNELLYGILVVLTFTGTLRIALKKGASLKTQLWAAVGCCLAWAIVDGAMYVFQRVASRNRSLRLLRDLREEPAEAPRILAEAVPAVLVERLSPDDWTRMAKALEDMPLPPRAHVQRDDLLGGIAIFLIATMGLLPLVAPFALLGDVRLAQFVSNGIALVLMFVIGLKHAKETDENPVVVAFQFLAFGVVLVGVTLALGG